MHACVHVFVCVYIRARVCACARVDKEHESEEVVGEPVAVKEAKHPSFKGVAFRS